MRNDQLCIAAIRSTIIDGINKAKSGHPGMALGSAPILYTLFTNHLVANPKDSKWMNRDRFVMSSGHASMLLYTMLHVAGYKVTMDDLKNFRQLNSSTPGHPEVGVTDGVDASAGPLGQGIGQAVGMALAERILASMYKEGERIFSHYTYCLCGDGCLQEGISQEAISFAGLHKLNKLIMFYDANNVTLDGALDMSFNEDVLKRFQASNWNTILVKDGNDINAINNAIKKAKKSSEKPTLIMVNTIIGYGSNNQGKCNVHGAPLGEEDGKHAKEVYGYNYPPFTIPQEVYDTFKSTFIKRGKKQEKLWKQDLEAYRNEYPEEYEKIMATKDNDVSSYLENVNITFEKGFKDSTRNTSQVVLNEMQKALFNLYGGSADVAKSVMTKIIGGSDNTPSNPSGHNINFGIRELAMSAIQNGMLLHGGLRTYVGCFCVFSDYVKPTLRLGCLEEVPAIYLFSHDSIAVGEDGPTHQPIEQLAMLRSTPGNYVYRPCDANEVVAGWKFALQATKHPTCLILSRQALPLLEGSSSPDLSKGGYVISKEKGAKPDFTIIATGSEVSLAIAAQEKLAQENIDVRVVSLPCIELFLEQGEKYVEEVFATPYEKRLSIEMLSTFGWHRFSKNVMGIDTYGKSAPASKVIEDFGFNVDAVVQKVKNCL